MFLIKIKIFRLNHQNQKVLFLLAFIIFLLSRDVLADQKRVPKGTERIVLATLPTVSPGGKRIAFVWAGDIWGASIEGGRAQRLTTHLAEESTPVFSPNGREIAFTSQRTGSWQIYIMPSTGGVARQITHHSEGHSLMDWYPDGKHLLIRARRDHRGPKSERFFKIACKGRKAGEERGFTAKATAAVKPPRSGCGGTGSFPRS